MEREELLLLNITSRMLKLEKEDIEQIDQIFSAKAIALHPTNHDVSGKGKSALSTADEATLHYSYTRATTCMALLEVLMDYWFVCQDAGTMLGLFKKYLDLRQPLTQKVTLKGKKVWHIHVNPSFLSTRVLQDMFLQYYGRLAMKHIRDLEGQRVFDQNKSLRKYMWGCANHRLQSWVTSAQLAMLEVGEGLSRFCMTVIRIAMEHYLKPKLNHLRDMLDLGGDNVTDDTDDQQGPKGKELFAIVMDSLHNAVHVSVQYLGENDLAKVVSLLAVGEDGSQPGDFYSACEVSHSIFIHFYWSTRVIHVCCLELDQIVDSR